MAGRNGTRRNPRGWTIGAATDRTGSPAGGFAAAVLRSGAAVFDQGLQGAATFTVHLLVARVLSREDYGGFAVAFGVYLFVVAGFRAYFGEAALVLLPREDPAYRRSLCGALLAMCLTLLLPVVAGVAGIGLSLRHFGKAAAGEAVMGTAVCLVPLVLFHVVHWFWYALGRPRAALAFSLAYFGTGTCATLLLLRAGLLSAAFGLGGLAAASIVCSACAVLLLNPDFRGRRRLKGTGILRAHRRLGTGMVLSAFILFTSSQAHLFLVPAFLGLKSLALLAAVENLYRPLNPVLRSLHLLLIPETARTSRAGEGRSADAPRFAALFLGGVGAYVFLVLVFRTAVTDLLYDGKYPAGWALVLWVGLSYVARTGMFVFVDRLKGEGRIARVVGVQVAGAVFVVGLLVAALLVGDLVDAVAARVAGFLLAALVAWILVSRPPSAGVGAGRAGAGKAP